VGRHTNPVSSQGKYVLCGVNIKGQLVKVYKIFYVRLNLLPLQSADQNEQAASDKLSSDFANIFTPQVFTTYNISLKHFLA
jgi:hypothetical protein